MFLFFNVGNKIFCFFKKWVLLIWTRVHCKGGSQVLQNFEAWLLTNGGGLTDLDFFYGGGKGGGGVRKKDTEDTLKDIMDR